MTRIVENTVDILFFTSFFSFTSEFENGDGGRYITHTISRRFSYRFPYSPVILQGEGFFFIRLFRT